MHLALEWLERTGQMPKPGRSDELGFGDLVHSVFQWLRLPEGSAPYALRHFWAIVKERKERDPLRNFLKRHGEEL